MKALFIIPIYNEEKNIEYVIDEIKEKAPDIDLLVIDDGSSDNSYNICLEKGIKAVIKLPYNLGIGGARQTGFKYALTNGYDAVIQLDGDGQHDPKYAYKMLEELEKGTNVCVGSRFIKHEGFQSSITRRLGIFIIFSLIKIITGKTVTDPTSGFRACDKRAIKIFASEYPQDYPEPESLVTASKRGLVIKEVPVTMNERKTGKSTIRRTDSVYYMIKVTVAMLIEAISK